MAERRISEQLNLKTLELEQNADRKTWKALEHFRRKAYPNMMSEAEIKRRETHDTRA